MKPSGPNDGRLIFDRQGRMWKVHDFAWWQWRRWLMWLRVCVDGRQRHLMRESGVVRLERVKGEVEG